ncbi:hypothetical protein KEJ25_00605 [Candidatus Bathyarchaeota archaeon]|nr:hypothetical protein [Candidatus Bathyarchaeota archaeon]
MQSSVNPLLIDEYRLNWSLRYLREAKVDYECLKLLTGEEAYVSLGSTAVRKAQTAVLYALGEPSSVYNAIVTVVDGGAEADNSLINALASMERCIRSIIDNARTFPREMFIRLVGEQISIAEKLLEKIFEVYGR